jgi:hypothetical protein
MYRHLYPYRSYNSAISRIRAGFLSHDNPLSKVTGYGWMTKIQLSAGARLIQLALQLVSVGSVTGAKAAGV